MPKLYIAGPMSGLPEFNYPAFNAAATLLTAAGHQVENPVDNENAGPYNEQLKAGLRQLLDCDGIALLDGWEASVGARLEVQVASTCGLAVRRVGEWLQDAAR